MDWKTVKFDWNQARAFLVTAEEGSLSAAARALGMAQPTLGRQVSALEAQLGVALFERVGRGLTPTPAGLELLEHVRAMGAAATQFSISASGQSQDIEGNVRISAGDVYCAYLLPPVVVALRARYPGICIELAPSNEITDLRRREADIAIRHVRPEDPTLIARRLPDDSAGFYASRHYLDTLPGPVSAERTEHLRLIGFDQTPVFIDVMAERGVPLRPENFGVLSSDHVVQWQLLRAGAGIAVIADWLAASDSDMRPVFEGVPKMQIPVWLTAHRDLATARRIRCVFDLLAEVLSAPRPRVEMP